MKIFIKPFIAFSFFCLLSGSAFSQGIFKSGLILGINGTQVDGDSMSGYNKGGLLAGVFVDFPINKKLSGSFELTYSVKGSKEKEITDASMYKPGPWFKLRITYIEIPVTLNYRFTERVTVTGGLGVGILTGTKYWNTDRIEDPGYHFIRPLDFFPVAGLSYKLTVHLNAFVRTEYSLFNIGKFQSRWLFARVNRGMHNNVISGGIRFYFGKNSSGS